MSAPDQQPTECLDCGSKAVGIPSDDVPGGEAAKPQPEHVFSVERLKEVVALFRGTTEAAVTPADHLACAGKEIDAEREIHDLAKTLINRAGALGVVVTIERRPLQPLAMGNAGYVVGVRPVRGRGHGAS